MFSIFLVLQVVKFGRTLIFLVLVRKELNGRLKNICDFDYIKKGNAVKLFGSN